jgi:DNA-binding IclR family transcriptional regulator
MMRVATGVGVLDKVMNVLDCFDAPGVQLTPRDIAERLGISTPTAYRLMQSMREHDLLQQEGQTFRLGVGLATLGARAMEGLDIRHAALPALQELNAATGENAHLTIRQGHVRVLVEKVEAPRNVRPFALLGEPLPLGVGASGLVLLAWLPGDQALELRAASTKRLGIDDPRTDAEWNARAAKVREHGYAISQGERQEDVSAVAAPVRNAGGAVVACISYVAPTVRFQRESSDAVVHEVMAAAKRASKAIGGSAG